MATVAAFTVAAEEFPLGAVFEDLPGVTVELERVVPTSDAVVPYFWVRNADETDVVRSFRVHPEAGDVELVDSVGDEQLLRCTLDSAHTGVLLAIEETGVTLLSGVGNSEHWTFEVRGDDREAVARFQAFSLEHDVPITLTSVHRLAPSEQRAVDGLTDPQREALLLAHERGYFDTPRRATLEELAGELDITRQSFAARLRRGHRTLIDATLL